MSETTLLGDRYILEELIARGGMPDVYRANDRVLHRPVAIKLLRGVAGHESEESRFAVEARTLAQLSHPSLVTILDADMSVEHPFIVMELVDGPSLADSLNEALAPERVREIGIQVADALAYAHAAGFVHRDVKPGNILLGGDGRARLTDFGIARLMGDPSGHTKTGFTIGTAAYLSPEQVRGEPVTTAADIYSLGLVLLEALTGERSDPGSPSESALARLHAPPAVAATVPSGLRRLLTAMTDLDPAARPAAGQVAAALAAMETKPAKPSSEATQVLPIAGVPGPGPGHATLRLRALGSPRTQPIAAIRSAFWSWAAVARRQLGVSQLNRRMAFLVAAAAVALVLSICAVTAGHDTPTRTEPERLPDGVPVQLQQPLLDLHNAIYGIPR